LGHPEKACRCAAASVDRYRTRISGPLLDRIDILIEVPPLSLSALDRAAEAEASAAVRERVIAAVAFRAERSKRTRCVEKGSLEERSLLTTEARQLLRQALVSDGLSGRGYVKVIGLARSIADLDQILPVRVEHLAEALALRLDQRRVGLL